MAVSDLSSWGSDSPPLSDKLDAAAPLGALKHSKGITDLSKFLNSDEDEDKKEKVSSPVKAVKSPEKSPAKIVRVETNSVESDDNWSMDDDQGELLVLETSKEPAKVLSPVKETKDILASPQHAALTQELKSKLKERGFLEKAAPNSPSSSSLLLAKTDDAVPSLQRGTKGSASDRKFKKRRRSSRASRSMKSKLPRARSVTTDSEDEANLLKPPVRIRSSTGKLSSQENDASKTQDKVEDAHTSGIASSQVRASISGQPIHLVTQLHSRT